VSFLSLIVAAAGQGKRLGTGDNKVFLSLQDRPLLAYTLAVAETSALVDEVVVVTRADDIHRCRQLVNGSGYAKVRHIVPGGAERQDSIAAGLKVVSNSAGWVAVHDGARPFLSLSLLERVINAARLSGAAIAALPVKETIKRTDEQGFVAATLERRRLWSVQTPQVFRYSWIMAAYREAKQYGWQATDDAALVEKTGKPVKIVTGEETNIKITTPGDLFLARAILAGES
jgi:2-C-methyl-D-erythritol 4-phosphate cytidylyltransferase